MSKVSFSRERWGELARTAQYNSHALARLSNLSRRHLRRVIQHQLGRPLHEWIKGQQMFAARGRLLSGEPVKAVAFEVGFKQSSHFCRVFKRFSGMTPSEFRAAAVSAEPESPDVNLLRPTFPLFMSAPVNASLQPRNVPFR